MVTIKDISTLPDLTPADPTPTDPTPTDPTPTDPTPTDTTPDEVVDVVKNGTSGNDTLRAGAGDDELYGRGGRDKLIGLAGDDLLVGGMGRDVLTGGDGEDTFDFNAVSETGLGWYRDTITDFETGADLIDLQGMDASRTSRGNQDFSWVDEEDLEAAFTGEAGQLRFKSGVLMGDTNGDGKADFHIKVVGSLVADDVIL